MSSIKPEYLVSTFCSNFLAHWTPTPCSITQTRDNRMRAHFLSWDKHASLLFSTKLYTHVCKECHSSAQWQTTSNQ